MQKHTKEFYDDIEKIKEYNFPNSFIIEEMTTPTRLAPHGISLVVKEAVAKFSTSGRIIFLHDENFIDAWEGYDRIVIFARSDIEQEIANDPTLCDVAWSWLLESLETNKANYKNISGATTRVTSATFGKPQNTSYGAIEIRGSWSPLGDLLTHAVSFISLLEFFAGQRSGFTDVTNITHQT